MPDGSDADGAYWHAGDQWRKINSGFDYNYWYNDGCTIGANNGRSETALVNRSAISGYNGLTTCWKSGLFLPYWSECDVKLANDMNYFNEDESFWNWSNANQGRVVTLHEFGHALGLGHDDDRLNIMRTYTPLPLVGGTGTHAEPYPTDAHGVRNLYGIGSQTNVFASAQWLFLGQVVATGEPNCSTINRCRGDSLYVKYTLANNGSTAVNNTRFRVYLNNSSTGYSGGWTIFSGMASIGANNHFTEGRYLTVPPTLPNGIYWIFWQLDASGSLSETIETDNYVHSCTTVYVGC